MIEIELKYRLSNAAAQQWLRRQRLGPYILLALGSKQVTDTYLDTPDNVVARAGYALRHRQKEGKKLLQLKRLSPASHSLHRRQELHIFTEHPFMPGRWPDTPEARFLRQIIGDAPLQPLFTLQQQRHEAHISQPNAFPFALLSLDDVRWLAGRREARAWELEIELLPSGHEAQLRTLATLLQDEPDLVPQPITKYERGLALLSRA
jgi:inorganic triphosphatase YgiF